MASEEAEDWHLGEAEFPDSKPSAPPSLEFKCTVFWSCQGQKTEDIFLSTHCALGTKGVPPRGMQLVPPVLRRGLECGGWGVLGAGEPAWSRCVAGLDVEPGAEPLSASGGSCHVCPCPRGLNSVT